MSKSRLEKFLYALYSLDSSDLPTPLSRIEELYKCLVTGSDIPTFEPISRVEKYLMAILGGYDVDSLPNPLSRVEVLLYKLATGDDNLDDVKTFLSEHEELLAEIIRNGGVGGNIDIEYVLYTLSTEHNTLYNTAEKPVKSAILKGKTLVNICKPFEFDIQTTGSGLRHFENNDNMLNITLDDNKEYSVWVEIDINEIGEFCLSHTGGIANLVFEPIMNLSLTSGSVVVYPCVKRMYSNNTHFTIGAMPGSTEGRLKGRIMVFEGDVRGLKLSYFDGMQSVKMPVLTTTGKNLININTLSIADNQKICEVIDSIIYMKPTTTYEATRWVMHVKPDTTYTFSAKGSTGTVQISNFLQSTSPSIDSRIYLHYGGSSVTFTTSSHTELTLSIFNPEVVNFEISDIQLEYGTQATSYEPYKSNILTVNEDVELRGIGEVKDELDLLTGELTQRIGEYRITGEKEEKYGTDGEKAEYIYITNTSKLIKMKSASGLLCDKFPYDEHWYDFDYPKVSSTSVLMFVLPTSITGLSTKEEREAYIRNLAKTEGITVLYELATPIIKTVDLSVVDQDGNDTELSTFNDITHVTLSSEGLIPEAEPEVATKNEEVLNTMSLEMDDISTTQNALKETSNTQSENVDATMIATTEIYEQLL